MWLVLIPLSIFAYFCWVGSYPVYMGVGSLRTDPDEHWGEERIAGGDIRSKDPWLYGQREEQMRIKNNFGMNLDIMKDDGWL